MHHPEKIFPEKRLSAYHIFFTKQNTEPVLGIISRRVNS